MGIERNYGRHSLGNDIVFHISDEIPAVCDIDFVVDDFLPLVVLGGTIHIRTGKNQFLP